MQERIEDVDTYYYSLHPTEEDTMSESALHAQVVHYLVEVLTWLFHGTICAIHENLGFYPRSGRNDPPIAPDIAIIKGIPFQPVTSWRIGKTGPAPHVVFEILSEETWQKDLLDKPRRYALLGVREYFAYDPNEELLGGENARRLFGWRLDHRRGRMRPLPFDPRGALWSVELDSFLLPAGETLLLYDRIWQLRLTEAQARARQVEAEAEARRAAEEHARILLEKLRSLGIDPNQL
jgi:Uma2 family endonuclease